MKLHLGCGPVHLDGWINIDQDNEVADRKLDLRQSLPYETASASMIFCEHFIEHVTRDEARELLRECRRVLVPDGVLRLSTPDLRWLVIKYQTGEV
ncbi:MAG: class I SAM-dependent methyltransferase, partial [Acetobacteraceae bacterium]